MLDRATLTSKLDQVANPSFNSLELFHTSHSLWPLPPAASGSTPSVSGRQKRKPIHIAIFDSSFNPPTKAHLSISSSSFPSPYSISSSSSCPSTSTSSVPPAPEPYTARLLLLSARNVDKTLQPGDASFAQRVEMMHLQALDMEDSASTSTAGAGEGVDESLKNVAVGALNFPTFVGKSVIIHEWIKSIFLPGLKGSITAGTEEEAEEDRLDVRLTFLIGSDTLTRLFIPKYYTPSALFPQIGGDMDSHLKYFFEHDRSRIVSARRFISPEDREREEKFIRETEQCSRLVGEGKIRFVEEEDGVGKGEEMGEISSTRVRRAVREGDGAGLERLCGGRVRGYVEREGLYKA